MKIAKVVRTAGARDVSALQATIATFFVGLTGLGAGTVAGQDYPRKPIRIVTSQVGGGSDVVARLIAQGLTASLGQQVVVDNRPSGPISPQVAFRALPDGYTLLVASSSFWIGPLFQKMPYDPVKDFSPITVTSNAPNLLVVPLSLPVKSVAELIALAKAKPAELNYASGANGGGAHLAVELFKHMASVSIERIVYKGGSLALIDVIAGRVQMTINDFPTLLPSVKSGKLRGLAVTSSEPSALVPGLPTVSASGLPGYESGAMQAMFAPANTPTSIINRLNHEVVRILNGADVKEKLSNTGAEVVASSPRQLAGAMKAEMDRMAKLIRDADIRVD